MLLVQQIEVFYQYVIQVLKGVSLSLAEGQIICLLGANGAGKSTTLKSISGLLASEDGRITDGNIVAVRPSYHQRPGNGECLPCFRSGQHHQQSRGSFFVHR